jgi:hypothetical protein
MADISSFKIIFPMRAFNFKKREREKKKKKKKKKEKYKTSPRGLLGLQFTLYGIKTNSKVPVVCKKNNLVPIVKFHLLT